MNIASEESKHEKKTGKKIGACFGEASIKDGTAKLAGVQPGAEIHFYIELLTNGKIALELMKSDGEPTGHIVEEGLSQESFGKKYKTCSHHKCPLKPRTVDEVAQKMSITRQEMGEADMKKGDFKSAEEKFNRAITLDEKNVQASFGLGKSKMEQGKVEEAMDVFRTLATKNEMFSDKEKHTLNEFGIYLRKKELYSLAVENYEKAVMLSPDDEVIYFNLARAYFEMNDMEEAVAKLREAERIAEEKISKFDSADRGEESDEIKAESDPKPEEKELEPSGDENADEEDFDENIDDLLGNTASKTELDDGPIGGEGPKKEEENEKVEGKEELVRFLALVRKNIELYIEKEELEFQKLFKKEKENEGRPEGEEGSDVSETGSDVPSKPESIELDPGEPE